MTPKTIQQLRSLMEYEAARTEPPKGFPDLPDIPAAPYVELRVEQVIGDV